MHRQLPASAALLGIVAVLAVVVGSGPDYVQRRVEQLGGSQAWGVIAWEGRHLPAGLASVLAQAWVGPEGNGPATVRYLQSGPSDSPRMLAEAVTRQLRAGGIAGIGGIVWPPVVAAVAEPPRVLVISPREHIRLTHWLLLDASLGQGSAEDLEREVERLGVSALAAPTGGISTYPVLIPPSSSPAESIRIATHEWVHLALFATPLGRAYGSGDEARAINETTADLVAEEVADAVYREAGLRPPKRSAADARTLRAALRRIRVGADEMLARGDVAGAELFMERERQDLAAQGYAIRRLNQAYFAFHGNYAEGPAPTTEVPDALRTLRARSASLADFLGRIGQITSLGELRQAVASSG